MIRSVTRLSVRAANLPPRAGIALLEIINQIVQSAQQVRDVGRACFDAVQADELDVVAGENAPDGVSCFHELWRDEEAGLGVVGAVGVLVVGDLAVVVDVLAHGPEVFVPPARPVLLRREEFAGEVAVQRELVRDAKLEAPAVRLRLDDVAAFDAVERGRDDLFVTHSLPSPVGLANLYTILIRLQAVTYRGSVLI